MTEQPQTLLKIQNLEVPPCFSQFIIYLIKKRDYEISLSIVQRR